MKISSLKYFLVDALKSMKRNITVSTASAATVAATLFILGIFLLTIQNVNQGIINVESKVEVIIVLNNNITISQQKALENKIKNTEGVVEVNLESKSQAMEKFKKRLGEQNKGLVEGLDKDNPLPNSYVVKVKKPEIVSNVVSNVKDMQGVESIKDGREIIDKLMAITKTIKWVGTTVFVVLIGVSLFLIGNTIKLTVYSRRREIGIMKFIGATDWFIRWPFIIEGVLIGIFGALIADGMLYYVYSLAYTKIITGTLMIQIIVPQYVTTYVLGIFLLSGVFIGVLGSVLSLRKFLAV